MGPDRLEELYEAVRGLLLEVGYERLTLDAVAARAHTSKATLYRQWNGKLGLVIAALRHGQSTLADHSAAGSIDEVFESMAAQAAKPPARDLRLAFALMHAASMDAEFGATLRAEVLEPPTMALISIFEQAADRGEIVREPALFRQLAQTIIAHFAFLPVLSAEPRTVAADRAFFASIIRPALTYIDQSAT
jgi:AcrR family transcriptional regulator